MKISFERNCNGTTLYTVTIIFGALKCQRLLQRCTMYMDVKEITHILFKGYSAIFCNLRVF